MKSGAERYATVRRLLARGLVRVFRSTGCGKQAREEVHVTPTVFLKTPPDDLLKERQRRLEGGLGTREWYLLTDEPLGEWGEELRGDLGILIVQISTEEYAAAWKELRA